MVFVSYAKHFEKEYRNLVKRNPRLKKKIRQKVKLFLQNPKHPSLRIHKVYSSKIGEAFSFWIEGDLRILFRWKEKSRIVFYRISNHKQIY
ncbi:type II toxin-antitoxin system RelE/ParE family toxin [Patescibacteria group bacterium]|nr:type II toxin-antitoxin system RelE/ParE family toxin [Patescibacteria group bacterium]MBU1931325.1 type II toxin-antitoxin system RelE/ParE family toxin [Patescibacteria group bacterium]